MIINEYWQEEWSQGAGFEYRNVLVAYDDDYEYNLVSRYNYGEYSLLINKVESTSGEKWRVSDLILIKDIGDNVINNVQERGERLVLEWLEQFA